MENKIKNRRYLILGILTLISIISLMFVENSKIIVKKEWFKEKTQAVRKTIKAYKVIKEQRFKKAIFMDDVNDPNQTALIGQEFTLITTKYGDLDAKLLSTNPGFAALIVEYLKKIGLKKGDNIALGLTGSFPGINISAIIAVETLGLNPIIVTSVGSSSWGANDPYFTWLDIENLLKKENCIRSRTLEASIGGGDDIGMGLSPAGRDLIIDSMKRNGVKKIEGETLDELIKSRMAIFNRYNSGSAIKAYINVGGGMASIGSSSDANQFPSGLINNLPEKNFSVISIIYKMLQRKIPVINLHNIRILAKKSGISLGNISSKDIGKGNLYTELKYNVTITLIFAATLIFAITLFFILDRKNIIKELKENR